MLIGPDGGKRLKEAGTRLPDSTRAKSGTLWTGYLFSLLL
jgi:hypothetical protein